MLRRVLVTLTALACLVVGLPTGGPSPAGAAEGHAFLLGDSVMAALGPTFTNAAAEVLGPAGWSTTFDAAVCRRLVNPSCPPRPATALEVVRSRRSEIGGVLVVGAGYNDQGVEALRAGVRAVLAEVPGVEVLWLTYSTGGQGSDVYRAMNAALVDEAAVTPNLRVVDWDAARQPGWTGSDGLHLTGAGSTGMATVILQALQRTGRLACMPSTPTNPPAVPSPDSARGYWLLDSTGDVHAYGDAPDLGGATGFLPASMQATPTGNGYWIVDTGGGVHAYGDAVDLGDLGTALLNGPVLRIEAHPTRAGYWLVASDGGVFSFGVPFLGSMGATRLARPVISMHATAEGDGYWLVASDGGVFSFGAAAFHGSTGAQVLNSPVVSMAVAPGGTGYWLYAADGGVFSFDVPFLGSIPGTGRCDVAPTVAMRASATGAGYWVVTETGEVFAFGDAEHLGDRPALPAGSHVVDMAVRR